MAAPLAPFPDVESERDRELVARHQRALRDLDGATVDGLVYEYRTQFHADPLVDRTETAYYLSVRSHVWAEMAAWLELDDAELARLRDAHAEQFRATVGDSARDEAMILSRP